MNYAIRNTVILLLLLGLLWGGGWVYMHYWEGPKLERIQNTLRERESQLGTLRATINQFETLKKKHGTQIETFTDLDKTLFPGPSQSLIYNFLNSINSGKAYIDYNLNYMDSKEYDGYGILRTRLEGDGYFRNLYYFISALEHSIPLNKIRHMKITNNGNPSRLSKVHVEMEISSYYYLAPDGDPERDVVYPQVQNTSLMREDNTGLTHALHIKKGYPLVTTDRKKNRVTVQHSGFEWGIAPQFVTHDDQKVRYTVKHEKSWPGYNPFYPLIYEVPKNTRGLPDVRKMKLVGITRNTAYIMTPGAGMHEMQVGDEVYLGRLEVIKPAQRKVIFRLNRGGIIDWVSLEVENPE